MIVMGDVRVYKLEPVTHWNKMLPVAFVRCDLCAAQPSSITAIMPFSGQASAVSVALEKAVGVALPQPNRALFTEGAKIIWMGPDQAFLLGDSVPEPPGAAIVDQSDGWAVFQLNGPASVDVLARLAPVDLRAEVFAIGHSARTALFHVPCSITRTGEEAFDIMVFRSMAETAIAELEDAMRSVEARNSV